MTKQTRLKHYKILLDAYETYEKNHEYLDEGFCWATKKIVGNRKIYDDFRSEYPELYKQDPKQCGVIIVGGSKVIANHVSKHLKKQ